MNKLFKIFALAAALISAAIPAFAEEIHQTVTQTNTLQFVSAGSKTFTGDVTMSNIYTPQAPSKSYAAIVTFAPGARTYWHVHDMGQTLIVTEGIGYTQEWGKKPALLNTGDIVRCPRSLNALGTLDKLVQERKAAGIKDEIGADATPLDPSADRLAKGTEVQTYISGRVVENKFAPIINTFLREHLFYDIFARDVIDWQQRELATVGALAGIGNVNPQLTSHFKAAMNTGLTPEQLEETVDVLNDTVDKNTAANAQQVLDSVLNK